jgi:hypothetical protein
MGERDSKQKHIADVKTSTSLQRAPNRRRSKQVAGVNRQPTLEMLAYVDLQESLSTTTMEFHMTIQTRVSNLSPRQASMLLAVAITRAVVNGIDFTLYLSIEYLSNHLRKSGWDTLYIKDERIRQTALLSELIISSVEGNWLNLVEVEEIDLEVRQKIADTGWLPSERTLMSWKQVWDLEKYLKVRIVPVENLMSRTPTTAERYSGYTRGYGNDGSPPTPGKTRPSSELDGDEVEENPPEFTLQEFDHYIDIINSIETAKMKKKMK